MKNKFLIFVLATFLLSGSFLSCNKDLNRKPTNDVTADVALKDSTGYIDFAAKMYAADALSGNSGNGSTDMQGFDAGSSDFLRAYWNMQCLSTDEAICSWGDASTGTTPMHTMQWTNQTGYVVNLWNRCYYIIAVCNEFINQSAPATLSSKGITGNAATEIGYYRAEARFLRAFQYWVLMDLWGSPAFIDENTTSFTPPQYTSAKMFAYIESELKAIDGLLKPAKTNAYGRVDQGAEWALLARLYLNAKVYTGTDRSTDAITYASKVINAGYSLYTTHPAGSTYSPYQCLFLADNNLNNPEVIWSLNYDGTNSQIYGGTTFLVNSSLSGSETNFKALFGVNQGWGGNRSTSNLPTIFGWSSGNTSNPDGRALFYTPGASTTMANTSLTTFTNGLPVLKYRNVTSLGVYGLTTSADGTSCSIDFPVFRLAEQYLIYCEAVLRGGSGGSTSQALTYFNALRQRAYGNTNGNVTSIVLNDIINERAKELYWECFRRTDLIRFGMYAGSSYTWPWEGNVSTGAQVDAHLNLFPIPYSSLINNPNLKQNSGY